MSPSNGIPLFSVWIQTNKFTFSSLADWKVGLKRPFPFRFQGKQSNAPKAAGVKVVHILLYQSLKHRQTGRNRGNWSVEGECILMPTHFGLRFYSAQLFQGMHNTFKFTFRFSSQNPSSLYEFVAQRFMLTIKNHISGRSTVILTVLFTKPRDGFCRQTGTFFRDCSPIHGLRFFLSVPQDWY